MYWQSTKNVLIIFHKVLIKKALTVNKKVLIINKMTTRTHLWYAASQTLRYSNVYCSKLKESGGLTPAADTAYVLYWYIKKKGIDTSNVSSTVLKTVIFFLKSMTLVYKGTWPERDNKLAQRLTSYQASCSCPSCSRGPASSPKFPTKPKSWLTRLEETPPSPHCLQYRPWTPPNRHA